MGENIWFAVNNRFSTVQVELFRSGHRKGKVWVSYESVGDLARQIRAKREKADKFAVAAERRKANRLTTAKRGRKSKTTIKFSKVMLAHKGWQDVQKYARLSGISSEDFSKTIYSAIFNALQANKCTIKETEAAARKLTEEIDSIRQKITPELTKISELEKQRSKLYSKIEEFNEAMQIVSRYCL